MPGVRGVKNLALQSFINDTSSSGLERWCLEISENRKPVLTREISKLEFTFYKNVLPFFPDKKSAVTRFKKRLINVKKAGLQANQLDEAPPLGRFRNDLGDYRTIQNDFPVVYGIGEGHLSNSASNSRKAKALQLKGYLLFFDQLFANYLGQLSNLRNLFSVEPEALREAAHKRTYFSQKLTNVPQIERLIQFYNEQEQEEGTSTPIVLWLGDTSRLEQKLENVDIPDLMDLSDLNRVEFLDQYPNKLDQILQLPVKKIEELIQLPLTPRERDVAMKNALWTIRNIPTRGIQNKGLNKLKLQGVSEGLRSSRSSKRFQLWFLFLYSKGCYGLPLYAE